MNSFEKFILGVITSIAIGLVALGVSDYFLPGRTVEVFNVPFSLSAVLIAVLAMVSAFSLAWKYPKQIMDLFDDGGF